MAPVEESAFFPSLNSCLDGNPKLFAWKTITSELSRSPSRPLETAILRHIQDPEAFRELTGCLEGPSPATSESKSEFETLTSAINITPTSSGRYDINQIKEDALWLSKEAGIKEASALRITVLEWQSRPAERLLQEDSLNVAEKLNKDNLNHPIQASILLSPTTLAKTVQPTSGHDFDSSAARRLRLLEIFVSESQSLLQTAACLIAQALPFTPVGKSKSDADSEIADKGGIEVGLRILKSWHLLEGWSDESKSWLNHTLSFLQHRLQAVSQGSGWSIEGNTSLILEQRWSNANVLQMVSALQITLSVSSSSPTLAKPNIVQRWFRFMGQAAFMDNVDIAFPDLSAAHIPRVQSLVALNSLAFVQLHQAITSLPEMSSTVVSGNISTENIDYLHDIQCIEEVTQVLVAAANASITTAVLGVFAWCIVLQTMREYASSSTEVKELRQSQRAIESFGTIQQSDTDSVDGESSRRRPSPIRRSSFGSDGSQQVTLFEDIVEMVQRLEPSDDLVALLANWAAPQAFSITSAIAQDFCSQRGYSFGKELNVAARGLLLDLIDSAKGFIPYSDSIMTSLFSILLGNDIDWKPQEESPRTSQFLDYELRLLKADAILTNIFAEALGRFPYESIPFVKLCRALTPYQQPGSKGQDLLVDAFMNTPSFTSLLTEPDVSYELGGDGDNISLKLTSPVNVMLLAFPSLKAVSQFLLLPKNFEVPDETVGRPLTDGKPIVALWNYRYSALRFFGVVLQNTLELRSEFKIAPSHTLFELSTEITGFLTTWMNGLHLSAATTAQATDSLSVVRMLEEASDSLSRNQDVIAVIIDLLEGELYKQHSSSQDADSMRFIAWGLRFLSGLALVMPHRVWPFLGRSGLLGLHGTESRLIAVVTAAELPLGEFQTLLSSLDLFEALIEDTINNSVSKRSRSKSLQRFSASDAESSGAGVSEATMKAILLQIMRILMDVFQSCSAWRFARLEDRLELNYRICTIFNRVLSVCFDADDENGLGAKLTNSLASSASYLVETFLSEGPSGPTLQPLLQVLLSGLQPPSEPTMSTNLGLWVKQTTAGLHLTTKLLRLNKFLERPMSPLCGQIFDVIPTLARLYAVHPSFCVPVLSLLEASVIDTASSDQPLSLLAHLGQATAKSFLDYLSTFRKPFEDTELSVATWKFFSAIVSERQQWLAVYLLTGRTPRERLNRDVECRITFTKPIIKIALAKLSRLQDMQPTEAIAMLEFVALAADYWEQVAVEMRNDQQCKDACLNFIARLKPANAIKHSQAEFDISQYQIAAYIVGILSLLVHHSNEKGDTTTLRHVLPRLGYLIEHGVSSPSYNASLHHSLKKNFEAIFKACSLSNFKRTSLSQPSLGPFYYYDVRLADQMLRFDTAWLGKSNRGYANEFARANLNLSVVEAQIKLFQNWKSLVMQLSEGLPDDKGFQETMALIVTDCLHANMDNTLPELVFERLATSRADLAFTLLQRLVEVTPVGEESREILNSAWALLRVQGSDIATLLVGDNAAYYRTLLRVLYLSLQTHVLSNAPRSVRDHDHVERDRSNARAKKAKEIEAYVLEILETIVARGFRSLIVALHEDSNGVHHADFALLIAIMRTALQVPGVASYSERLLTFFEDERTAQYASTLLSWSDQLATDGDPVYGELSMTFLLELSNLPTLAESLVVSGTFAQATTTNLFNSFRKPGGKGPFDEPTRLYCIWARGFLPLVINLLSSIGPPIAAELSTTLSQFEAQISRASHCLGVKLSSSGPNAGYVTFSMANEVHALALITTILNKFRESGSSLGIVTSDLVELPWDSSGVREDLETRLQRRNNLRNSIVPTDEHEEAWSRQKPMNAKGDCESRLEEKVIGELKAALSLLGNTEL